MKKIAVILASLIVFLAFSSSSTNAATGYQGYAVYRDGVAGGLNWHAGLMDSPYSDGYLPVLQHPGFNNYVEWSSWSDFIDGNTFKGVYKPNLLATSAMRDAFVATGRLLRTENISYHLTQLVNYSALVPTSYVYASDINGIRCDGVIEYIYEFNSYRVFGYDDYDWDVSYNSYDNYYTHSGFNVTPKSQAQSYLTLVTTSEPSS